MRQVTEYNYYRLYNDAAEAFCVKWFCYVISYDSPPRDLTSRFINKLGTTWRLIQPQAYGHRPFEIGAYVPFAANIIIYTVLRDPNTNRIQFRLLSPRCPSSAPTCYRQEDRKRCPSSAPTCRKIVNVVQAARLHATGRKIVNAF